MRSRSPTAISALLSKPKFNGGSRLRTYLDFTDSGSSESEGLHRVEKIGKRAFAVFRATQQILIFSKHELEGDVP
jgi:hypothetical protein